MHQSKGTLDSDVHIWKTKFVGFCYSKWSPCA